MEHVVKDSIPVNLHSSELFSALGDGEHDAFEIPRANLKPNDEVHSLDDARHLLITLRYWGLFELPNTLV
jgi:hypothetical protein